MLDYKIISDGSCDLTIEEAKSLNVEIVPFSVCFSNEEYKREGYEITPDELYNLMVNNPGVFPKSSLPSVKSYYDVFTRYAKEDIPMIVLCITKKFSGSFNSALSAKELTLEEYPNAKIEVIDTIVNTVLQGLFVKEAARLQSEGKTYEEVINAVNNNKDTGRIFFTVSNLSYLQHGGRIGKLTSIVGDFLKITPLITLKEGEIFNSGVAITRKRAMLKVKELLKKYLEENNATPDTYRITVGYGYDKEEGYQFKESLEKQFPEYDFEIAQIGATISVHTGPHPIGVGIVRKF